MKQDGEKIVMLTAYDYPTAQFAEGAGVDIILVGDSVGMVVLGYDSTTSVTATEMIHHGRAVKRGAKDTFIIVDMPFGTFHGSHEVILRNAIQIFQKTSANALKVEGADEVIDTIRLLTKTGIPVVGHLGLLPQLADLAGGYKVQAKTAEAAKQLIMDAKACERAGAIMIVLECIPHQLAAKVTKALSIPVIGIGAGAQTDGQVLVFHDLVKLGSYRIPKFVEQFVDAGTIVKDGVSAYVEAVKSSKFPAEKHQFSMENTELDILMENKDGES